MNRSTIVIAVSGALAAAAVALSAPGAAQADLGSIPSGPSADAPSPAEIQQQINAIRTLRDAIRTGQIDSTAPIVGQNGPLSIPAMNLEPGDLEPVDVVPPAAGAPVRQGR